MWVLFSAAPPKSPDLALTAPIPSHPSLHRQVRRRSGRDAFIGVVGVVVVGRCRRARAQARPRAHVRLASKRRRALRAERPRGVQRCGLRLSTALRSRRRRAASRNRARMQPARHRPRACPPWRARRDARERWRRRRTLSAAAPTDGARGGARARLTPLHTARVTSSRQSFVSISPPLTHAAARARLLALTHARSRRVVAVAAAAAATDDARDDASGGNVRAPYITTRTRRHRARHSSFRSPLPLARARRRSVAYSRSRARGRGTWRCGGGGGGGGGGGCGGCGGSAG